MKKSLIVSFFLISIFCLPYASHSFDGIYSAGPIDGFMYMIDQDKLVKVSQQNGEKYDVAIPGAFSVPLELWSYQDSLVLRIDFLTDEAFDEKLGVGHFKSKIFLLNRQNENNPWNQIGEGIDDIYVINSLLIGIDVDRNLNIFKELAFNKVNTERVDSIVRERVERWESARHESQDIFVKVRRDKRGHFYPPIVELQEVPENTEDQYIVLFRDGTSGHLTKILGQ